MIECRAMESMARHRRFRYLIAVLALCGMAAQGRAQGLDTGTDQRVELLSIIFHLAGSLEYSQGAIPG